MTLGFATFIALLAVAASPAGIARPDRGVPAVVRVNIFAADGSDPRQVQTHDGPDKIFVPIGRISTNQRVPDPASGNAAAASGQKANLVNLDGTAFLVSPCYAMTNYHVIFGSSRIPGPEYTATLYTFTGDGTSMIQTLATPVMWGAMAHTQRPDNDWVLLRLADCIGSRIGWLELGRDDQQDVLKRVVTTIGFAADKDPSSLWRDNCQLYRATLVGEFLDDCAVVEGSSGSPIMVLNGSRLEVVALSEGELNHRSEILPDYTSPFANVAIDVRSIAPSAARLIAADISTFGQPNPADEPYD